MNVMKTIKNSQRIKKEVKELGADYAEAWVHYSVLPNGPFCTRGIGKVQS